MMVKTRIENLENWLLRQTTLLAGHKFKVRYNKGPDTFTVFFEKMAHSTLTAFKKILMDVDLNHVEIEVGEFNDDFYPASLQKKKRRKRFKKKKDGKLEVDKNKPGRGSVGA